MAKKTAAKKPSADNPRLYYGTKRIEAWPQKHEDGREGYGVRYPDSDGYVSWSPKDVFDNAYHDIEVAMPFGVALAAVADGYKISRHAWPNNDKVFVFLMPAGVTAMPDIGDGVDVDPYLAIYSRGHIKPFMIGADSMLATDWKIVK